MESGADIPSLAARADQPKQVKVAIVDYGVGNLFSVKHACEYVGMCGIIASSKQDILAADVVILPGVGAYGDAMNSLRKLDLVNVLQDVAASGKPLIGICLGMQLLLTESYEFGRHSGLGIIAGEAVRFENPVGSDSTLKVPHVGWNHILPKPLASAMTEEHQQEPESWRDTPLRTICEGAFMYFVHSFYPKPEDTDLVLSVSHYGGVGFCSSLQSGNIFACQFHPERSGVQGLRIYQNVASRFKQGSEDMNV